MQPLQAELCGSPGSQRKNGRCDSEIARSVHGSQLPVLAINAVLGQYQKVYPVVLHSQTFRQGEIWRFWLALAMARDYDPAEAS